MEYKGFIDEKFRSLPKRDGVNKMEDSSRFVLVDRRHDMSQTERQNNAYKPSIILLHPLPTHLNPQ